MTHFGKTIQMLRQSKGLTQPVLAKLLGKNRAWIANIETGRTRIFADDLSRLADALEINPSSLLDLLNPNPKNQERESHGSISHS